MFILTPGYTSVSIRAWLSQAVYLKSLLKGLYIVKRLLLYRNQRWPIKSTWQVFVLAHDAVIPTL